MDNSFENFYAFFYKELRNHTTAAGDFRTKTAAYVRAEVAQTLLNYTRRLTVVLDADIQPNVQAKKILRESVYDTAIREGWVRETAYTYRGKEVRAFEAKS